MKQDNPEQSDLPQGLSQPACRALVAAGYMRLEQFTNLREAQIKQLHGVEPKALDLLRRALASRGLSFADESHK